MRNQTTAKYNIDDFDDLTRFADENFDTNEVDLFQFSGNESSPLTQLKSVILSLDWDITDEYLQELADELAHLAPEWQDDKVAGLYLQGMGKIGKYLRLRGAHAHPNSIKLLLTYFHHFETIVSSPDMGSDRIAQMVHNDVRKFKVLQYQIKLKEDVATADDPNVAGKGLAISRETGEAEDCLRNFKAAILELDWEVSDNSLTKFSTALKALGEEKIQNRSALILIQGMQALGQYISDERAQAHPEVFNLLHSFHDGLEQILDTGPAAPDQVQKKNILLDRVNHLNHLKKLIAPKDSEIPAAIPMPQVAAKAAPAVSAAIAAQEAAVSPATVSEPVQEEPAPALTEALAEAEPAPLPAMDSPETPDSDEELALVEEDIFSGIEAADEPETDVAVQPSLAADFPIELDMEQKQPPAGSAGIESEIDALFAGTSKRAMLSSEEEYPDEVLPESAYQAVDDEVSDGFIDTNVGERHGIVPALADADEESGFDENDEELFDPETQTDLDEQLDFLFGESPQGAEQSELTASLFEEEFDEPASPAEPAALEEADLFAEAPVEESLFAESAEEVALFLEDDAAAEAPVAAIAPEPAPLAAGLDEDDDEEDEAALAAAHDDLPAALADAELPAEELLLDAEPDEEITSKLDSFFDFAEPAEKPEAQPEDASVFTDEVALAEPEPAALMAEEAAPAEEPAALSAEESYAAMPAALADAEIPEENLFATEETVDEELTGDLDSFFAAADEAIAPVPPPVFEEEEELAIALEKPASAPQESVISAMEDAADDSGEVIAALAEVEPEEDLFALQTEEPMDLPGDEANTALQEELDNFFDALPATGQEPTDVERAILAVEPEETEEESFEEEGLALSAETAPLESALADVAFSEKTAGQSIEVNPEIENLVNSFWDDKPSVAASPLESAEVQASEDLFALAEEESAFDQPLVQEDLFSEAPAPDAPMAGLDEQKSSLMAAAAVEDEGRAEMPQEEELALFAENQEQEAEESEPAGAMLPEDDLFAAAEAPQADTAADPSAGGVEKEDLQLESSASVFSPSGAGFDDILDSSEVEEFLLSGQDIEDIPDEELEFTEEAVEEEPAPAASTDDLLQAGAAIAAAESGVPAEDSDGQIDDTAFDLAASAPAEEPALAAEDDLLAVSALLDAEPDAAPAVFEESVLAGQAMGTDQPGVLAALGASLPLLLANYTPERLSGATQHLQSLRTTAQLSSVQSAAADMLETVIAALPRHTGGSSQSKAVVDSLYQALAQPKDHIPLETVTAYTGWVQSLLSDTLLSEPGAPDSKEYFTARDIYQELSGFRTRMEEELAALRQEIRNK